MAYTGKHIDESIEVDGSGNVTIKGIMGLALGTTTLPSGVIANFASTNSIFLPRGTTAQRPGSPSEGYFRYNTTDSALEIYDGSWTQLAGLVASTISEGDSSVTVNDAGTGNVTVTVDGSSQLVINASSADFQDNSITTTGNITTTAQLGVGGGVNSGRELTVVDSAGSAYIAIESNATSGLSGVLFGDSTSDTRSAIIHDNSNDSLIFRTNGANDRITIDSSGVVNFSGNITTSGTVDGRDIAADGSKLDGIEASADVTDTANVTAAGAVMDSELTDIAAVKALNQGVATTDSPTFAAGTITGDLTVDTNTLYVDSTNNRVGVNTASPTMTFQVDGTDAIKIPIGTTAQRPTGASGLIRFNTTTSKYEGYNGNTSQWGALGGSSAWESKTSAYTAIAGDRLFGDTSGGAFTITLPSSPLDGDEVWFADPGANWATNNLTVDGNGNNIAGATTFTADLDEGHFIAVYDGTAWVVRFAGGLT